MNTRVLATIGAGLLGLVIAAVLGYLALQLVSQPAGLAAIPARTGDDLVSASKQRAARVKAAEGAGKIKSLTTWSTTSQDDHSTGDDSVDDHDGHDGSSSSGSNDRGHDSKGDDHDDD